MRDDPIYSALGCLVVVLLVFVALLILSQVGGWVLSLS